MPRKIAVVVRDRQSEAFRISGGLIMMDDVIDVFVLDRKVAPDADTQRNYGLCKEVGLNLYTNNKDNTEMQYLSTEAIADKLLEYDIIDPY
ncbi:MAG: hypothetical protein M0Z75_01420 [Nitrospiraceae bacterium]|nr:hypothetical protein [Nitrospiraceae bacterium]